MSGITRYTKSIIIAALKEIRSRGWIKNRRNVHNDGAIGNTLEDMLSITGVLQTGASLLTLTRAMKESL